MKDIIINAVKKAGKLLMANFNIAQEEIFAKGKNDFVTLADTLSEKTLVESIHKYFPEHSIQAEENLPSLPLSEYTWIIDPLDGTTNYIHKFPFFSISVALAKKGEIVLGVVFDPLRQELFYAERGKGAWLNERPIHTLPTSKLSDALVATGFPFRHHKYLLDYLSAFKSLFLEVQDMRRAGSAALDLCYVACGRVDAFWEFGLSSWDVAAGSLIVEEAGGVVSDLSGGRNFVEKGHIIASNSFLHPKLQEILGKVFEGKEFL